MYKNHLYFDENPNGKLFNERFNDVRIDDENKLVLGNSYEIFLNEKYLGKARIVALKDFMFQNLSDVLSYLTGGTPLKIFVAKLKNAHQNETFEWNTKLYHLIMEWQERDLDNQAEAIHQWWNQVFTQKQTA